MASVVIVVRAGEWADVYSPFAAKDTIKAMPYLTRIWDQPRRLWQVRNDCAELLAHALRRDGFTVALVREEPRLPPPATRDQVTWADRLFAEIPRALADRAFSALARVFHPDAGGSTEVMQALNAARDRARGRRPLRDVPGRRPGREEGQMTEASEHQEWVDAHLLALALIESQVSKDISAGVGLIRSVVEAGDADGGHVVSVNLISLAEFVQLAMTTAGIAAAFAVQLEGSVTDAGELLADMRTHLIDSPA